MTTETIIIVIMVGILIVRCCLSKAERIRLKKEFFFEIDCFKSELAEELSDLLRNKETAGDRCDNALSLTRNTFKKLERNKKVIAGDNPYGFLKKVIYILYISDGAQYPVYRKSLDKIIEQHIAKVKEKNLADISMVYFGICASFEKNNIKVPENLYRACIREMELQNELETKRINQY